jgi:glycosyltransferase involved in cell wall biosynthesis
MKLGLVLPGPVHAPLPSTRVALLNVLPLLRAAGVESEVLHAPEASTETPTLALCADAIVQAGIATVVFQKVHGPSAVALARDLERRGVRTVFVVCDRIVPDMAEATSATACVTHHLAGLYPGHLAHKMHVVHDGIERPDVHKTAWRDDRGSPLRPLRAVLVTSSRLDELPGLGTPPPWLHVDIVGRYPPRHALGQRAREHWRAWQQRPERRGRQLRIALHPRVDLHAWHPDGVYERLLQADIGIIPVDRSPPLRTNEPPPDWSVKSENRLTLKMSVGLPVVATPIPAYEPVVRQGENGYLATTRQEWRDSLERLRDPAHRAAVGRAARERVHQPFSMAAQAERLLAVLRGP